MKRGSKKGKIRKEKERKKQRSGRLRMTTIKRVRSIL